MIAKAKTIRRLMCNACGAAIGSGGLCSFKCRYDSEHEDARPEGSVTLSVYVLSEERPYIPPRRAAQRQERREGAT